MGGSGGGFFKESKPAKLFRDPKKFLNKQFNPTTPHDPGVPDAPQFDAGKDEELRQALLARLRQSIPRGTGRAATIGTSEAGVTSPSRTARRTLGRV